MNIGFTKMHGIGNDFIVIDNFNGNISLSNKEIALLCDRYKGIGADGLILVETKEETDCFMNYYNGDGTEAEMCGNGVRCIAKFLKDYYLKDKNIFNIATRAGNKEVKLENDKTFSVNMGKPVFSHSDFPEGEINLENLNFNCVSVGNPHAIAFVGDLNKYDLLNIGPKVENNSIFPNKINVELVEKNNEKEFTVKVWERGCGATMACGTAATAVYARLKKINAINSEIVINLPGGKLFMSENENGEIIMRGEAKNVFSGVVDIN